MVKLFAASTGGGGGDATGTGTDHRTGGSNADAAAGKTMVKARLSRCEGGGVAVTVTRPLFRDRRTFSSRCVLSALGGAALLPLAAGTLLVSARAQGAGVFPVTGSLQANAVVAALAELDSFVLRRRRRRRGSRRREWRKLGCIEGGGRIQNFSFSLERLGKSCLELDMGSVTGSSTYRWMLRIHDQRRNGSNQKL